MSASVNKVILIGNVGQDPIINENKGHKIGTLSIATTRRFSKNGERAEETEWHYVTVFDKIAELVEKYVRKGTSIYICGRLRTRKWQTENGQMQHRVEVVCEEIQLLSSLNRGGSEQHQPSHNRSGYQANAEHKPAPVNNGFDDGSDIPF